MTFYESFISRDDSLIKPITVANGVAWIGDVVAYYRKKRLWSSDYEKGEMIVARIDRIRASLRTDPGNGKPVQKVTIVIRVINSKYSNVGDEVWIYAPQKLALVSSGER